ncbi:hypothetical protein [Streptomyces sp. MB09-02B]|uniref:hypothetical protein n=1 Tax=Streptomyces sp. MB09-02B TaxID=3028667 RepID=UPI0029A338A9|nr:hypothetical protein [Streptomyces sp. MB09-02B]MDX3638575.1 hypothetical protein [Streptomyces sp. MB09-02B]
MRIPVPAIPAAAASAAAIALLSTPAAAFAADQEKVTERPASYAASDTAFREALTEGTLVGTMDYCEPGANIPGRCS